jgi:hypothetical protein
MQPRLVLHIPKLNDAGNPISRVEKQTSPPLTLEESAAQVPCRVLWPVGFIHSFQSICKFVKFTKYRIPFVIFVLAILLHKE